MIKKNTLIIIIVFFYSLKIASPFGIFILSFLIPNTIVLLLLGSKLKIKNLSLNIIIVFLISISYFLTINWGIFPLDKYAHYYYLTTFINIILISLLFESQRTTFESKYFWDKTTKVLISINLFFFFIQIFLFYGFNYILDFGLLTQGNEIRGITQFKGIEILRASGLYEEPSIYSAYMFSFLVIRYISVYNNFNKLDFYLIFGVLSLFLTTSILSAILGIIFISLVYIKWNLRSIIVSLISMSILIYISWDYMIYRITNTINGIDPSNATKMNVIKDFIDNDSLINIGYGIIKKHLFYGYDGLGDTTLYISLITIFGIYIGGLLTFFIIFNILKLKYNISIKLLIAAIFIKFSWPGYTFFWFLYLFIIFLNAGNHNNEKHTIM
ncbi:MULTISPECIES: hypothetical protein [Proteus]|uniref:hypothetical protein n=1 Tax=Proteus TaxID=583 RepID=UPI0013DEBB68|nr:MULTISPECIES: hypothetical protein [Proteus]MBG5951248.1 hypothetical protein [Proteus terrae]MCM2368815.1 hypothetical protein [Proteus sp. FZP2095]QIF96588.1 hypothetical protein GTH25_00285 [Proteus terrae subsp. cibarius]